MGCGSLTRLTARIWPRSWITRFGSTMPPLSVFARGLPDCYRQVATGFDVLASRVVAGKVRPDDLSVAARSLAHGLATTDASGYVDPGYSMDSAWRVGCRRSPASPISTTYRPG